MIYRGKMLVGNSNMKFLVYMASYVYLINDLRNSQAIFFNMMSQRYYNLLNRFTDHELLYIFICFRNNSKFI